ncbi:hypothetical protein [Candidatus Thiosymbion oneisti]|uniref:hypothetical protein n=1 Tax=Candidatus Thiosymbion oneisti TaxID=589554 RepID=UPI000B7C6837|nr:hypothetical protein [Candidatus Thiosymbion oneisti]
MSTTADPLRDLYRSLSGQGALSLEPDDPYYVPILQGMPDKDPILMLWQRLDWSESESVNLLTGFRGNGKSTELRRLKQLLETNSGAKVFLVNMLDFLLMTKPLELSDFVLSLMTALGQAVEQDTGLRALTHGYWERLQNFLTSEVQLNEFKLDFTPAKLGLKLKNEPDFKERIQNHLRGHLSRLIEDAKNYVVDLVQAIRKEAGDPDLKVVLLVDSVEQIRGVGTEAQQVHESVVDLFSGQADKLDFPQLHLVYTVPPYLQALSPNQGRALGGHPIVSWPNVHVRDRKGNDDAAGLAIMEAIIDQRQAGWRDVIPPDILRRLAIRTGGDLRDFFRLIRECVVTLSTARLAQPDSSLDEEMVKRVEEQLRNELLPLAADDARWLARIHVAKDTGLETTDDLPDLARFLDGNLIMNYLNGEPWYDIHPLLLEEIKRHADDRRAEE